jgi:hypothetical protein
MGPHMLPDQGYTPGDYYAPDVDYGHPPACPDCRDEASCECECCQEAGGDRFCEACCAKAGPCLATDCTHNERRAA